MRCGFLILLSLLARVSTHVYERGDAIVTEANSILPINGLPHFFMDLSSIKGLVANERPCLTYDRRLGSCRAMSECYPYTRLHKELTKTETWVIGTRGTCSYVEPDGKQYYGVCCDHLPEGRKDRGEQKQEADKKLDGGPFGSSGDGTRIVNGVSANRGEFSFMAAIESDGQVICGGSLLDSLHILTAAHCIESLSPRGIAKLRVIMGVTDLNDSSKVVRKVKTATRHKQFDNSKLYNDVALLTLASPVSFSSSLGPVCLGNSNGLEGKNAVTVGWGRLSDGGPSSNILQKVTIQIKSQEDCRQNFGSKAPGGIVDHFMCAASPGKDSCAGDSGGPLLVGGCQVGIVSWGIGCATDTYGVYTRISSFQSWIEKNKSKP